MTRYDKVGSAKTAANSDGILRLLDAQNTHTRRGPARTHTGRPLWSIQPHVNISPCVMRPADAQAINQHSRWGAGSKWQEALPLPTPDLQPAAPPVALTNPGYDNFKPHYETEEAWLYMSMPDIDRCWHGTALQKLLPRFPESIDPSPYRRIAQALVQQAVETLQSPGHEDAPTELDWLNEAECAFDFLQACALLGIHPARMRLHITSLCPSYYTVGALELLRKRGGSQ